MSCFVVFLFFFIALAQPDNTQSNIHIILSSKERRRFSKIKVSMSLQFCDFYWDQIKQVTHAKVKGGRFVKRKCKGIKSLNGFFWGSKQENKEKKVEI